MKIVQILELINCCGEMKLGFKEKKVRERKREEMNKK